jgi:signal transduction histidine kinase
MLHEFLSKNRRELGERCQTKVAHRAAPGANLGDLEYGIPLFIEQLIDTLEEEARAGEGAAHAEVPLAIGQSAGKHGNELLLRGFTVDQVVHDYGDLCQALTELAREQSMPITVSEFHTFNRCLDNAIAGAVTEFGRERDRSISEAGTQSMNERLGSLAHEHRTLLNAAMLAFQAIASGSVGIAGPTGGVLSRSLIGMRDLVDRSLADVRLTHALELRRESIPMQALVAEIQISAAMDAAARGCSFTSALVDEALVVDADRPMLVSAIVNLLENAFKFTRPGGNVTLRVRRLAEQVLIEVQDECGGLPQGRTEDLFQPFEQRGTDRTGIGLGLSISRRAIEANGGKLRAQDLPGSGCIFSIQLPSSAKAGGGLHT